MKESKREMDLPWKHRGVLVCFFLLSHFMFMPLESLPLPCLAVSASPFIVFFVNQVFFIHCTYQRNIDSFAPF